MTDLSSTKNSYLAQWVDLEKSLASLEAPWLKALRNHAMVWFMENGFPTTKNESFKYTNLSLYLNQKFALAPAAPAETKIAQKLKALGFETDKSHLLVFINGLYSPDQSSVKPWSQGVQVQNLASALSTSSALAESVLGKIAAPEKGALTALNSVFFKDGLWVYVSQGQALTETVHVVYLTTNAGQATQSHIRNVILLESNSEASVIEHFLDESLGPSLTNAVTEVQLGAGARLTHVKIQAESAQDAHFGSLRAAQDEDSRLVSRTFSFGGKLVRNEIETFLAARRAECVLDGLFMAREKQHVDNQTFIDHKAPYCACHESFKGVLDGESVGIFDGRVLVRENAQKTDARQSNQNLLLAKTAKVYSKPQLQIYADDVKCSHGSSTGQMDEEALFYLRARGLSREEAKHLLISAFAGEMVERVEIENLKAPLRKALQAWLEKSGEGLA
jgi:Fe-S cluster assembly protein SufD